MRNSVLSFLSGGALIATLACGTTLNNTNTTIVYAQAGQTVKELVDGLPPGGGTVSLGIGTWSSGYNSSDLITRPNITIQGSGMPGYNSTFTSMSGGTIVQGHLPASTGADYLTVRDLGVDAGSAYINANNAASQPTLLRSTTAARCSALQGLSPLDRKCVLPRLQP